LTGHGFTGYEKCLACGDFEGAQLYKLLKNSLSDSLVSGHDFSRADKPFIFDVPSGRTGVPAKRLAAAGFVG
jgi:hypothetical protein